MRNAVHLYVCTLCSRPKHVVHTLAAKHWHSFFKLNAIFFRLLSSFARLPACLSDRLCYTKIVSFVSFLFLSPRIRHDSRFKRTMNGKLVLREH